MTPVQKKWLIRGVTATAFVVMTLACCKQCSDKEEAQNVSEQNYNHAVAAQDKIAELRDSVAMLQGKLADCEGRCVRKPAKPKPKPQPKQEPKKEPEDSGIIIVLGEPDKPDDVVVNTGANAKINDVDVSLDNHSENNGAIVVGDNNHVVVNPKPDPVETLTVTKRRTCKIVIGGQERSR